MSLGIVNQSLAAVRREPSESSEMVNQLLFGESFTIIESYNSWLKILSSNDLYEGWVDTKLVELIPEEQPTPGNATFHVASNLFTAKKEGSLHPIRLCPGSTVYNFNKGSFNIGNSRYFSGDIKFTPEKVVLGEEIVKIAQMYANSPYLWGGRSPFGVDCSGLVQVVYKIAGFQIPRDSSQQVKAGETIDFINLVKPADLAFFDNEEGIITHVGILTGTGKIIHSSGYVRIDNLDHQGIFNIETQKYTHKLRVIKRIVPA